MLSRKSSLTDIAKSLYKKASFSRKPSWTQNDFDERFAEFWESNDRDAVVFILNSNFNLLSNHLLNKCFDRVIEIADIQILDIFLKHHVDFKLEEKIEVAAMSGHQDVMLRLLVKCKLVTNIAIANACTYNHPDIIELFIKFDISPDYILPIVVNCCEDAYLMKQKDPSISPTFAILDNLLKVHNADPTKSNYRAFNVAISNHRLLAFGVLLLYNHLHDGDVLTIIEMTIYKAKDHSFLKNFLKQKIAQDITPCNRFRIISHVTTSPYFAPKIDDNKRAVLHEYGFANEP